VNSQHFSEDVLELLSLLNRFHVRYLIVGGEAVIYHGYARLTGDVDFFYEISEVNSQRLFESLTVFWGGAVPEIQNASEFRQSGLVLQYGRPPNRIDLINYIDGITFQEAWESRVEEQMSWKDENIPVYYMGLECLIRNKKASGRDKDRDDLKFLISKKKATDGEP